MATDHKALLELLQEMISIESINPSLARKGSGETGIARFLGRYMEAFGLEVRYQELGKNRTNAIGILKGTGGGKTLMLNGHIDTVGVDNMEIDPFDPQFKEGKVFGRGSMDMKSGVAAMIMAVKNVVKQRIELRGDVIIACVADEEYASIGTEALVKSFEADGAIVTEPTDLQIMIAHKGFVWSKVKVKGVAAHGSRPKDGVDAILKMGKVLAELDKLDQDVLPQTLHPLLDRGSVHASIIKGGAEMSIYPDFCELEIERRTLPGENLETVRKEQEAILNLIKSKDPDFQASLDVYLERAPLEVSPESAIVKALDKAYQKRIDKPATHHGVSFWTDAAFLAQAGIPTVIFGPSGKGLHGAIEYVDFDSVVKTAEIISDTIRDFCG